MDQNTVRNLVNVFNDIDEMRGIVRIVEPAPACSECDGFGYLTFGKSPFHSKVVCRHCRGTGWAKTSMTET